jgi:hypothetical protein
MNDKSSSFRFCLANFQIDSRFQVLNKTIKKYKILNLDINHFFLN